MFIAPNILVTTGDYKKLHESLDRMPYSDGVGKLIDELDRAEVVDSCGIPEGVVTMHSTVSFTVLQTNKSFTYKLVFPGENLDGNNLSVMTPVGSALLGLSVGQEIEWSFDSDKTTHVRVDAVLARE